MRLETGDKPRLNIRHENIKKTDEFYEIFQMLNSCNKCNIL